MEITETALAGFLETILPHLDERRRRLLVGVTAVMLGRGGRTKVAELSGVSRPTVAKGANEIETGAEVFGRQRSPGGGAKPAVETQPGLFEALDALVDPQTRGSPVSSLRWTSKSTYQLADELVRQGYRVSAELVRRLLHQMGYSLQAPAKQKEGTTHPDRNAQFAYLNSRVTDHLRAGEPVISVDTKKKELVGDFHNGGREWQPSGQPEPVRVHDFIDPGLGKAIPYGIYDLSNDEGWVSVGDTADTAEFAANTIRRWWHQMGQHRFGDATRLLITADAGGSNGYRIRAWKTHLAASGHRNRPDHHRMPLPARHLEMEQDRTPHVQLHHSQLARPAPHLHTHHRRAHRRHHHQNRAHHPSRPRPHRIPQRRQNQRRRTRRHPLTRHDWHGDWNYTIRPT